MSFINKHKPSPFYVLGLLTIAYSIVKFFSTLKSTSASLGAFIFLLVILVCLLLIYIDRKLINHVKWGRLSLYEILILFIGIFLFLNHNKRAEIVFRNPKTNYISTIYGTSGKGRSSFSRIDYLNQELIVSDTNIVEIIDKEFKNFEVHCYVPTWICSITEDTFFYKDNKVIIIFKDSLDSNKFMYWTEEKRDSVKKIIKYKISSLH